MTFAQVLEALLLFREDGKKFSRHGWNRSDLFITSEIPTEASGLTIPFLCLHVPGDPEIKSAWVPSQSDMHIADWFEVKESFEG